MRRSSFSAFQTASLVTVAGAVLVAGSAAPLRAQSAQAWSLQASGLLTTQRWENKNINGGGAEGQIRYTSGLWSWGFGGQWSTHSSGSDKLTIGGGFVEPRFAIDAGSETFAPYLAGRAAFLTQNLTFARGNAHSSGYAFGAGAGTLIKWTSSVNVDLGVALLSQKFSDVNFGNGTALKFDAFVGYVVKAGLSFGLGN